MKKSSREKDEESIFWKCLEKASRLFAATMPKWNYEHITYVGRYRTDLENKGEKERKMDSRYICRSMGGK